MFDKLKELKQMQDQAKQMQNTLSSERVTVSEMGIVITMDGNMQITDVVVNEKLLNQESKEKLQTAFKVAHREAMKRVQKLMAGKMRNMGGFPRL